MVCTVRKVRSLSAKSFEVENLSYKKLFSSRSFFERQAPSSDLLLGLVIEQGLYS